MNVRIGTGGINAQPLAYPEENAGSSSPAEIANSADAAAISETAAAQPAIIQDKAENYPGNFRTSPDAFVARQEIDHSSLTQQYLQDLLNRQEHKTPHLGVGNNSQILLQDELSEQEKKQRENTAGERRDPYQNMNEVQKKLDEQNVEVIHKFKLVDDEGAAKSSAETSAAIHSNRVGDLDE